MAGGVAGAGNAGEGNRFSVYGLGVDYERTLDKEFKFKDLESKVNGKLNIGELYFDSSDGKIHTINSHGFWTILNHKKKDIGENAATRSAVLKLLQDQFGNDDALGDVLDEIKERLVGGANARKPISRDEVRVMISLLKHEEEDGLSGGKILSREQVRAHLDISESLKTSGPAVRRAWENLNGQAIKNYIRGWGQSSVLDKVSDNVRRSLKGERTVNDPKVALKNYFFEEKPVSNKDKSAINGIFMSVVGDRKLDALGKVEAVKKSLLDSLDAKLESSDCVSDEMVEKFVADVGHDLEPVMKEISRGSDVQPPQKPSAGVDFLKRQVNGLSLGRTGSPIFYISDSNDLRGLNEKLKGEIAGKEKVLELFGDLKDICLKKTLPADRAELLAKIGHCIEELNAEENKAVFRALKTLLANHERVDFSKAENLARFQDAVTVLKAELPEVQSEIRRLKGEVADSMLWQEPFLKPILEKKLEKEEHELDELKRQRDAKAQRNEDLGNLPAEIGGKEKLVKKLKDDILNGNYSSLDDLSKADTLETMALKREVENLKARIASLTEELNKIKTEQTGFVRALGAKVVSQKEARELENKIEQAGTRIKGIESAIQYCSDLKTKKENAVAAKVAAGGKGVLVNRQALKAQMKKWFAAVVRSKAKDALDRLFADCRTDNDLLNVLKRPGVHSFLSMFAGDGVDGLLDGMMNGKLGGYDEKMFGRYNFKAAISDMEDAVREWTEVVMATSLLQQRNKALILSLSEYMRIKAACIQPWQSDSPEAQEILPLSVTTDQLSDEALHDDTVELLTSGAAGQPQYDKVRKLPLENIVRIAGGKQTVVRALVVDWLKRYAPDFVAFKLKQLVHFHHLLKPLKQSLIGGIEAGGPNAYQYDTLPEGYEHVALEKVLEAQKSFTGDLSKDYPEPGSSMVNFVEGPKAQKNRMQLSEVQQEIGSSQDAVRVEKLVDRIEGAIKCFLRDTEVENIDEILLNRWNGIDFHDKEN